ncbi:MAG: hypothetical protein OSA40_03060 [Phycisphaerales bacterium]|nr:hypothetical protein [Phycisphaerales bacterium]
MSEPVDLSAYLANAFLPAASKSLPTLPLADESHVAGWRSWRPDGPMTPADLAERMPQAAFAIEAGMAKSPAYRAAILAADASSIPSNPVLPNGALDFSVQADFAGHLPVVRTHDRDLFEWMFRTLGARCEPVPISPQVHALLITGLIAPGRITATHEAWDAGEFRDDPAVTGIDQWNQAMPLLDKADPTRFRDRLLIVHDDVYAGLEAIELDPPLDPTTWLEKSRIIRHHHEFAHYATRRLFQNMRLNLHDEIIADCMGFLAAFGRFDSTLFLRAMGIESDRVPVSDARAWTYVQGLTEPDVLEACRLTIDAARNTDAWIELMPGISPPQVLQCLARTSLPEIAGPDAIELLTATLES